MKHVITLDVSKGSSTFVIYNAYRQGVLEHNRIDFELLHERIVQLIKQDGQISEIIFEATDVYSKSLESF